MDTQDHGAMPGLAAPELAHQEDTAALVKPTNGKAPDAANVEGPMQTETQFPILRQTAGDDMGVNAAGGRHD